MQKILELENGYCWMLENGRIIDSPEFSTTCYDFNLFETKTLLSLYNQNNEKIILSVYDSNDKSINDVMYRRSPENLNNYVIELLLNTDIIDYIYSSRNFDISYSDESQIKELFNYKITYSFNEEMVRKYIKNSEYDKISEMVDNGYTNKINKKTDLVLIIELHTKLFYNEAHLRKLKTYENYKKILPICFDLCAVIVSNQTFAFFQNLVEEGEYSVSDLNKVLKYSIMCRKNKITKYILEKGADISYNNHECLGYVIHECFYDSMGKIWYLNPLNDIKKLYHNFSEIDITDILLSNMQPYTPLELILNVLDNFDKTRINEILLKAVQTKNYLLVKNLIDMKIYNLNYDINLDYLLTETIKFYGYIYNKNRSFSSIENAHIIRYNILEMLNIFGTDFDKSNLPYFLNESIVLSEYELVKIFLKHGATKNMINTDDLRVNSILHDDDDDENVNIRNFLIFENI